MNCGITINITTMMMDGQIQQIQFTKGKKTRFSSSPNFPTKNDGNQNCQKVAKNAILPGKEFTTTAISELDHVKIKCPDGN